MQNDIKYLKFASDIFWGLSIVTAIVGGLVLVPSIIAIVAGGGMLTAFTINGVLLSQHQGGLAVIVVTVLVVFLQIIPLVILVFLIYTFSRVLRFLARMGEISMGQQYIRAEPVTLIPPVRTINWKEQMPRIISYPLMLMIFGMLFLYFRALQSVAPAIVLFVIAMLTAELIVQLVNRFK